MRLLLRKHALRALAASLFLACALVRAAPMEEVDYVVIDKRPVANTERIEVIEFFYYGCGTCNRFNPLLEKWLAAKPADVEFRRVAALRRYEWIPLTRLYFTLEQLGVLPRLHSKVYQSVHEDGRGLSTKSDMEDWAEAQGLDRARFEQVLMSDETVIKVQKARDTTVEYAIRATPTLIVDGRYLTTGGMLGSVERLIEVLDGLVAMAREARQGNE
ncbi:MAG: thiol:disulfide interchange protein DsbA/DsbL [Burkholderiales bacterium]